MSEPSLWSLSGGEAEAERLALVQSLRDEGKSYREIAEMTEMSKSAVHRLLEKVN